MSFVANRFGNAMGGAQQGAAIGGKIGGPTGAAISGIAGGVKGLIQPGMEEMNWEPTGNTPYMQGGYAQNYLPEF